MNTEQLNQLKPGDEIFIRARYKKILGDGDVSFTHSSTNIRDKVVKKEGYTHPKNVISSIFSTGNVIKNTETATKYDPSRKLKKGDKVKPRVWRDRVPSARLGATRIIPEQRTYEVFTDELHEFVKLISGDDVIEMHVCHLELVTPVEELEPYSVEESGGGATLNCFIVKRGEKHVSYYLYKGGNANHYYTYEQAKARAEIERDRLNAEYRKEQNNE